MLALWRSLLLGLALTACADPAGQDSAGQDSAGQDSPGLPDPDPLDTPDEPTLSAEEVVADIVAGLALLDTPAPALLEEVAAAMAAGDTTCPGPGLEMTSQVPEAGCTASTGWWYVGMSSFDELPVQGGEGEVENWRFWGDMEIRDPEEHALVIGGFTIYRRETTSTRISTNTSFAGTLRWDGSPHPGLAAGYSGDWVANVVTEDGQTSLSLTGQVTAGPWTLSFSPLLLEPSCGQVEGQVWHRGPDGLWYTFEPGDDCDGCGPVRFHEQVLGEACLDASALQGVLGAFTP